MLNAQKVILPREIIRCAFCGGKGTDPFNVMSDRSTCSSCDGRGALEVPVPHVRCVFCAGSGSYKTYRCPVCGGAGVGSAPKVPTRTCEECQGSAFDASSGLPCLACHGHGVVPR
jgi:DnaJ-class molecular chaperone